jgi:hypothetical protein
MKSKIVMTMFAATVFGFTAGCAAQQAPEESPAAQDVAPEVSHATGLMTVTGNVVETMDAATYTYVRVDTGQDELWAASGRFEVEVGDTVTVSLDTPMENFHSDSLDRTFPLIYFASRILREGGAAQAGTTMPAGHPPITGAAPAAGSAVVEPVEAAEGGKTVAEIWAGSASLAGSTVTIRGRVVKFNGGILGRNWLHLQDGSGDAAQGTHDLTVTTDAVASLGTVVTVTGTVAIDQDFGAGYVYPILLEGATVESK